jgi:REP element-mobilizing transposase RayT
MRKPRYLKQGAKYHVIARANRQEMILESPAIKELLICIMQLAKVKYNFIFYNFCIMDNHIHFIIEPLGSTNLSKIMQWILGVFAKRYNKIRGVKGHVWYDRFKSNILADIFQYINTYIYIMRNPVEAGIVKTLTDYHYNGISFMLKGMMDLFQPS